MKIYVDEFHHIVGLRTRPVTDTEKKLREIEVEEDFLADYCDIVKKGFCYEVTSDYISVYPYKDILLLMSLQEFYTENQVKEYAIAEYQMDLDYRLSCQELNL